MVYLNFLFNFEGLLFFEICSLKIAHEINNNKPKIFFVNNFVMNYF